MKEESSDCDDSENSEDFSMEEESQDVLNVSDSTLSRANLSN